MSDCRRIVLIQAGQPPQDLRDRLGEQSDWFRAALPQDGSEIVTVRPFREEVLPAIGMFSHAIITGSWSMVTEREDRSERTGEWIRHAVAVQAPLLGVCYGHQLMADALGGKVDYHPAGREVGVHQITTAHSARHDHLMNDLPHQFDAFLTHEQSVLMPPACATVLAGSKHDPRQILSYGSNAWSTQFHPEFTPEIMATCIEQRREHFLAEGHDVDGMLSRLVIPRKIPQTILRDFILNPAF
ncbi:glutamine amidotransferase [Gluconobacter cerinus]|uniref:GMP synthase n=1 Tax=Gluconobacter cerinus TaxID=38307 RepID=A0AAV5NHU4_9PROT|nr:glutamine amidotransferase [Gluconobacter cerinus]GBQ96580.1 glutamine amidotransferase [Gluconobacter cerinus NRIC 0229]GLQ63923.1 GMP synthase [Gluconobacter cerinus]